MGSRDAEVPGSARDVGSAVVMGAKGVLGRRPLPGFVAAAEDDERPAPRNDRRIWLKLLLAFDVEVDGVAAVVVGCVCGASAGERKRFGSIVWCW